MERKKLREAREAKSLKEGKPLSQQAVADAIGCSREAYSSWERGEATPQEYWVDRLLRFFDKKDPKHLDIYVTIQITEGQIAMLQKILDNANLDRREALELVSRVPALAALIDALAEPQISSGIVAPGQSLSQCTAAIKAGFHLLKHGEYDAIDALLNTHAPTLTQLANTNSGHQKVAAGLTVQMKILQTNLAMRNLDFAAREAYCLEAVDFGHISGNPFALVVAQYWQGNTYICCYHQPQTAIDIFNDALAGLSSEASLSRSAIYSDLSVAYAQDKTQKNYETKAQKYAELARKTMPNHPELESWYPCLNGHAELDDLEGQMYLCLAEHSHNGEDYAKKAYNAFHLSLSKQAQTKGCLAQVLIRKAAAALALGDLHEYAECMEKGMYIAFQIDSKRRKSEALKILDKAPDEWKQEETYQKLAKMF